MAPPVTVKNLTFIHIPKTAGYSITMWLSINFKEIVKPVNYKEFDESINPTCHPSLNMIDIDTETFAVVRNPWDRVVSLWAFWNTNYPQEYVNFETFVNNLHTYKFGKEAWFNFAEPQKSWIPSGVTYLLKYETLEEDFKQIQAYCECEEPLPLLNKTEHGEYQAYYTPELWDVVANIFREDIIEYGY